MLFIFFHQKCFSLLNIIIDGDRATFVILLFVLYISTISFVPLFLFHCSHSVNAGNVMLPSVFFLAKIHSFGLLIKHSNWFCRIIRATFAVTLSEIIFPIFLSLLCG